jgi:hypothetical protein
MSPTEITQSGCKGNNYSSIYLIKHYLMFISYHHLDLKEKIAYF